MSFVLPAPKTFGGQFGAGLGASLPDAVQQFTTRRREEKERTRVQELLEDLSPDATFKDKISILVGSGLSPESQKQGMELLRQQGAQGFADKIRGGQDLNIADIVEGTSLGYIPPGLGQELARPLLKDPLEQQILQQLLGIGGEGEGEEEIDFEEEVSIDTPPAARTPERVRDPSAVLSTGKPVPKTAPRVTKSGKGWSPYSDEDLTSMAAIGGNIGKSASLEQSRRDKVRDREERDAAAAAKALAEREQRAFERNKKYLDHISTVSNEIPKERLALQQMRGALENNDFNSYRNIFAEMTGLEALKTSSAQAVNSATKQFLMSSLAGISGRPNQFIEQQITKALVSPLYTDEANQLILEGLEGLTNLKEKEVEISGNLENKYTSQDKEIPRTFQKMVKDQLQPEARAFESRYERRVRQLLGGQNENQDTLTEMPSPAGKEGQTIEDTDTGIRYRSDGKAWRKI